MTRNLIKNPIKRYYDTNALIYFFSKTNKNLEYFPGRSINYQNYACCFVIEEAFYIFIKKNWGLEKQWDIDDFVKYTNNFNMIDKNFNLARGLFTKIFLSMYKKGLIKRKRKDKKADVKDVLLFSIATINDMDEFITFDGGIKTIEKEAKALYPSSKLKLVHLKP